MLQIEPRLRRQFAVDWTPSSLYYSSGDCKMRWLVFKVYRLESGELCDAFAQSGGVTLDLLIVITAGPEGIAHLIRSHILRFVQIPRRCAMRLG